MSTKEDTELSRLKSQFLVLKNAYQEEQRKNEKLNSTLNVKENQIECYKKEIKDLTNKNVTLNKAVVKNQAKTKNFNFDSKNAFSQEDFMVLHTELNNKIEELSKVSQDKVDQKNELTSKICSLEQQINRLKNDKEEKLNEEITNLKEQNLLLKNEVASLESKLIELFAEIHQDKIKSLKSLITDVFNSSKDSCHDCKLIMLKLVEKFDMSESKSLSFEMDCKALKKNLELNQKHLNDIAIENFDLKESLKKYKTHINEMTEHIASLNEKIVNLSEEIEIKKLAKNSKSR